jgi:hypothetical protein
VTLNTTFFNAPIPATGKDYYSQPTRQIEEEITPAALLHRLRATRHLLRNVRAPYRLEREYKGEWAVVSEADGRRACVYWVDL